MEEYLTRALRNDITDTQLQNVIRILIGKSMISNHSLAKINASNAELELEAEENQEEEVEIDEIIGSYISKG